MLIIPQCSCFQAQVPSKRIVCKALGVLDVMKGIMEVKTIFQIIMKYYLALSFSFLCEYIIKFFRNYMAGDIAINQM